MDDGPAPTPTRTTLPPEDRPPARAPFAVPRGLIWGLTLFLVVLTIATWVAFSAELRSLPADDAIRVDPATDLAGSNALAGGGHPGHSSELDLTGQPVPATPFTTFEGGNTSLAGYRGRPLVVNFWSSLCALCVKEMPDIERVHQHYGERVAIVGVAVADGENTARALARVTKVTYQLGLDPTGQVGRAFGLVNLPATILVDPSGTVVHTAPAQALTADQLTALIEEKLHP
jgi:cytochrome c biogenesis protein CcmG/thiol:disulfide interchange protein DsbE